MAHWTNLQRFANLVRLNITSERSGGLHLVGPGLTEDRPVGRQSGGLVDEIWTKLEILKTYNRLNYLISALFSQGINSATLMHC